MIVLGLLANNAAAGDTIPQRIVSLDYCADQYVLKMVPKSRILAVSPDAGRHFSYLHESAEGVPRVRPLAEDVLVIRPDLVVRSYGGGPQAIRFFERAGVPVLQVPYASDIVSIRSAVKRVADGLGAHAQGLEIVSEMDARLQKLAGTSPRETVLYMTPTGVTSGPGTLIHEMLQAAGYRNFETRPGWWSLPLERLAYEQPDVVAAAFFDETTDHPSLWSPMRHPIARRQLTEQPTVVLQGSWTSCGGWFLLDAIEALAAASPRAQTQ